MKKYIYSNKILRYVRKLKRDESRLPEEIQFYWDLWCTLLERFVANYSVEDVVKVTRCKDCIYSEPHIERASRGWYWCKGYQTGVAGNHFCKYGAKE